MQVVFSFFIKKAKKILDKLKKMGYNKNAFGVMAQLVERLVRNEEASGSNPLSSTKNDLNRTIGSNRSFFCYANRENC